MLRVALIHGQHMFREAVAHAFRSAGDLEVAATGQAVDDAREIAAREQPDVLVLDLDVIGGDGIAAARALSADPRTKILVLSGQENPHLAADAFVAGARGYALKSERLADLFDAVRVVARGGTYLAPALPRDVLVAARRRALGDGRGAGPLAGLSEREREIFRLAVRGEKNADMAKALGISVKTIERHRSQMNRKLGLHSPSDLIRFAAANALLPD